MTYGQTNRQTENSCEPSFMWVTITTIPKSTDLSKASYMHEALFADHSGLHFSSGSFLENGVFRGYFGGNKHFFSGRLKKFLCQVASGSLGRRHFLTACSAAHRYGHKTRTLDWNLLSFLWKIRKALCLFGGSYFLFEEVYFVIRLWRKRFWLLGNPQQSHQPDKSISMTHYKFNLQKLSDTTFWTLSSKGMLVSEIPIILLYIEVINSKNSVFNYKYFRLLSVRLYPKRR